MNVAPVERCIRDTAALPLPDTPIGGADGRRVGRCHALPGGAGRTADAGDVVRGIGWGVAIKNLMYSEGFDDYSTARCRLADGVATLKFATSEVGQGFVTIAPQIARTILGVDDVVLDRSTPQVGSAGSTSASRQTWMSGGAVDAACRHRARAVVRARRPAPRRRSAPARRRRHRRRRHGVGLADRGRRGDGRGRVRRDGRVPPPGDRGARRERPGQLPHGVRLRRPPGGRRRRPRLGLVKVVQIATARTSGVR
jgi:hypothetical protein